MKAKLNKHGVLSIKRNGKYKDQDCPYHEFGCSDSCPRMEEGKVSANRDKLLIVCGTEMMLVKDERGENAEIDGDFLSFAGADKYEVIIANPPFDGE